MIGPVVEVDDPAAPNAPSPPGLVEVEVEAGLPKAKEEVLVVVGPNPPGPPCPGLAEVDVDWLVVLEDPNGFPAPPPLVPPVSREDAEPKLNPPDGSGRGGGAVNCGEPTTDLWIISLIALMMVYV